MQDLAAYGSGAKADLSTLGRMREHEQRDQMFTREIRK